MCVHVCVYLCVCECICLCVCVNLCMGERVSVYPAAGHCIKGSLHTPLPIKLLIPNLGCRESSVAC